jgi:hypothetical protein
MTQRKPWLPTLILVGVAVALGAYIFLVEAKKEPPPDQDAPATPAPLWEFEASDVMEITVVKGEQTVAVERGAIGWRMTAPEEAEADSTRLDSLAFQVASLKSTRAMADVDNLADFGLDEPEVQVTLVFSDGTTVSLSIGAENPRHTARYIQQGEDPLVYLVTASGVTGLLELVDTPPYPPPPTLPPLMPTLELPASEPTLEPTETPVPTEPPEPTATPSS